MKLGALIIVLLLVPKPAMSQEGLKTDLDFTALLDQSPVTGYRNLHSEITHRDRPESGVVGQWRERVFSSIAVVYQKQERHQDIMIDYRLRSMSELNEQMNENRMVSKAVLKETLRFAQDQLPEVERLVRILRFEVSSDMIQETETKQETVEEQPSNPSRRNHTEGENRLFVKTGLRIPVEGGRLNILSETEATFGRVSSYFKMYLSGRNDSRFGLVYILGRDTQVQVERQIRHGADDRGDGSVRAKEEVELIQLVRAF